MGRSAGVMGMKSGSTGLQLRMHGALIVAQLCFAGFDFLCKLALTQGVSPFVFPLYRCGIAFMLLAVPAFIYEKEARPRFSASIAFRFLMLGATGLFFPQVFYLIGMKATSATFASATQNMIPAFTFLMAAMCGLEKICVKRHDGVAKLVGTLFSVSGAMIMTLYRGPILTKALGLGLNTPQIFEAISNKSWSSINISDFPLQQLKLGYIFPFTIQKWQIGAFCLVATGFSISGWLILQVPFLENYPAPFSCAAFTSLFGSVQLFLFALLVERDPQKWIVTSKVEVVAIIYSGIFASGIYSFIQTWCNHKGGPLLVASYQPLETVFVGILGVSLSLDSLYLGSLVGATFVVMGLFALTWGQGEEKRLQAMEHQSKLAEFLLA